MENNLPTRKPTRLKEFDYSQNGYYFITICTDKRKNILSNIVGEGLCALPTIKLTAAGEIIDGAIRFTNENYVGITVDKYVIMPNHIHLIIKIENNSGGDGTPPLQMYDIIGRLKSFATKKYGEILFQRSFHDHIIRNEQDYLKIWNYIDTNPAKWKDDCFYVK